MSKPWYLLFTPKSFDQWMFIPIPPAIVHRLCHLKDAKGSSLPSFVG